MRVSGILQLSISFWGQNQLFKKEICQMCGGMRSLILLNEITIYRPFNKLIILYPSPPPIFFVLIQSFKVAFENVEERIVDLLNLFETSSIKIFGNYILFYFTQGAEV